MAYDEALGERIRDLLATREAVSERKMFGGLAFMVGGNMACGVMGSELMVRMAPNDAQEAIGESEVRPMDFTGKPMKGMIYVSEAGIETDQDLAGWVDAGADFAASLPAK